MNPKCSTVVKCARPHRCAPPTLKLKRLQQWKWPQEVVLPSVGRWVPTHTVAQCLVVAMRLPELRNRQFCDRLLRKSDEPPPGNWQRKRRRSAEAKTLPGRQLPQRASATTTEDAVPLGLRRSCRRSCWIKSFRSARIISCVAPSTSHRTAIEAIMSALSIPYCSGKTMAAASMFAALSPASAVWKNTVSELACCPSEIELDWLQSDVLDFRGGSARRERRVIRKYHTAAVSQLCHRQQPWHGTPIRRLGAKTKRHTPTRYRLPTSCIRSHAATGAACSVLLT